MTDLVTVECPICGHRNFKPELQTRDFFATQQEFTIQSCTNCELWVTQPQPSSAQLPGYYQSNAYISHQKKSRSVFDSLYFFARSFMLRKKLQFIEQHQPKGKLLDYGCGTAAFLEYAANKGWTTTGYEPSEAARSVAPKNLTIHSNPETLEGPFDVITLWHVLEHLPNLTTDLIRIEKLLRPGGLLVIAVPNRCAWDATHYQQYWAAYDVPRHLWHFAPGNINRIFSNHRLTPIKQYPLWLDSFYVSLLSEGYQKMGPVAKIARACWHGLFSNWKARQTGNYSSLIYLARK
jgi:SAM-dependent methyltransferase